MNNIFLMDPRLGPEDRLTYAWAYVLNVVPGLGQRVVDHLVGISDLPPSTFEVAIEHPPGTQRDRPDMLLRSSAWDLILEHKLDAGLGERQLERYLEHAAMRDGTRLALVAQRHGVVTAVLDHPRYLRPRRGDHLLWQDLYPLVASSTEPLAQHFAEYLGSLGLRPSGWAGHGDPFTDVGAAEALREVMGRVAERLRAPGRGTRVAPTSFAIEVRNPLPHVALAYLVAKPSIAELDTRVGGRALILIAWVRFTSNARVLSEEAGVLAGSEPTIYVRPDERRARWDASLRGERVYSTPLDECLGDSNSTAESRVCAFVERCLAHLDGAGEVGPEGARVHRTVGFARRTRPRTPLRAR